MSCPTWSPLLSPLLAHLSSTHGMTWCHKQGWIAGGRGLSVMPGVPMLTSTRWCKPRLDSSNSQVWFLFIFVSVSVSVSVSPQCAQWGRQWGTRNLSLMTLHGNAHSTLPPLLLFTSYTLCLLWTDLSVFSRSDVFRVSSQYQGAVRACVLAAIQ